MSTRYQDIEVDKIKGREIFFDANVIVNLFFPLRPNDPRPQRYSNLYAKIITAKNNCIVDFVVLSEVINRAHRQDFISYSTRNPSCTAYKEYRNTPKGEADLAKIYYTVENVILSQFTVDGRICCHEDVLSFLAVDGMDFNDKFIAMLCKDKGYVLLTDDVDFKPTDIDILSANSKLTQRS